MCYMSMAMALITAVGYLVSTFKMPVIVREGHVG
jgi:hypothetical protein